MSFSCLQADKAGTSEWIGTCASDDFKHIACVSSTNGYTGIKLSNDYGNTWYDAVAGITNNTSTSSFRAVCCSSDFSKITAVREGGGGGVWTSSHYGLYWTQVSSANINNATDWYGVCGSSDMSIQYAVQKNGNLYASTDSGNTWVSKTNTARAWRYVCCDSTGTKVAAVVQGGSIWISTSTTDLNLIASTSAGTKQWRSIACTPDFTKLVATAQGGGGIWISTDSGATWTSPTTAPTTGYDFVAVACSADFKNIIAASYGSGTTGYVYSTNSGSTWTTYSGNAYWHACVVKNNRFAIVANYTNVNIGRFDHDTSLFKIKGGHLPNLISHVPISNSNTGSLVEIPINYTKPVFRYKLIDGTNPADGSGFPAQNSTGLSSIQTVQLDSPNGVGGNLPGSENVIFGILTEWNIPNITTQPSRALECSNVANTSSASYLRNTINIPQFQSASISFWIRPKTLGVTNKYTIIMNFADSVSNTSVMDIGFDGNSNKIVFAVNNNFTNKPVGTTVINTNTWYHVLCTFNANTTTGKIYINNVLESSFNYGVALNFYNIMMIGAKLGYINTSSGGFQAYNGFFALLNIFNRELTTKEVDYLYYNPDGNIENMNSQMTLFKGTSSANTYASSGGGIPYLRGQPPFGATPYSKVVIPYRIAGQTIPEFAPYYTIYEGTSPFTGAGHTLQPWTTRVFIIAIGGGGGGGGGNYQTGGGSGGGGGGGGGAGMAYAYCSVTSSNVITLDVSGGGGGGLTTDLQPSGTNEFVGGNGLNGTTTSVYIDGTMVVRGYFGNKAKNYYNPNTNISSYEVPTTSENNKGGAPGDGGPDKWNTNQTAAVGAPGNPYRENNNGGAGVVGTYSGIILSGKVDGDRGGYGEDDPESTSRPANGGTSGPGGNSGGIQIAGQEFITNSTDIKFIRYASSYVFCNGSTIRTNYGAGGKGGLGESRQATKTAGDTGKPGAVFIFEYMA